MPRVLIWRKLASRISGRLILAAVHQSSLHLSDPLLIVTWEHQEKGNGGYFEKMFLKAAYFQTNHSLAAEHVRWRSDSQKKYFGNTVNNKFYLLYRVCEAQECSARWHKAGQSHAAVWITWGKRMISELSTVMTEPESQSRSCNYKYFTGVKRPPGSAASTFILIPRV